MKKSIILIAIILVLFLSGCVTSRPQRSDYKDPAKFEKALQKHYEKEQRKR